MPVHRAALLAGTAIIVAIFYGVRLKEETQVKLPALSSILAQHKDARLEQSALKCLIVQSVQKHSAMVSNNGIIIPAAHAFLSLSWLSYKHPECRHLIHAGADNSSKSRQRVCDTPHKLHSGPSLQSSLLGATA